MVLLAQTYDDGWLPAQVQNRAQTGLLLTSRVLACIDPRI